MANKMSSPLTVLRFSCWHFSDATAKERSAFIYLGSTRVLLGLPSLVMNEMNSLTHSCMHSLASLAILAFSGKAVFMIRATGAKLRILASDARVWLVSGKASTELADEGQLADTIRTNGRPVSNQ